MSTNPILAELHAIRREYAERFNQDLHAICVDARRKQGQQGRLVVSPTPTSVVACRSQQDDQRAAVRSAAERG
ncbi:MAG: hypothetical protein VBE63_01655 [Lamprobacter sp.]|uniref:hypothetical protein n=1 Tax=Lamprobacter sp. TaxID=3100796 RepID=UPI002B2590E8|nr:hypothetical protein [Lamprobacter sp.]MEA3638632.1 hypothetical protein [Lamprobacter sp.]